MPSPRPFHILNARDYHLQLGIQTKIMGILNLTPDSFSGDGFVPQTQRDRHKILAAAEELVYEGADIIDLGGESSRPGSSRITPAEEKQRIIPTLELLAQRLKVPISIDTYKVSVAQSALDAGASIINNIRGIQSHPGLLRMVKNYQAAIVLMHMRGTPQTMQRHIAFRNVIRETIQELREAIEKSLEFGILSDRIMIDPGIGFGKTIKNNLELLHHLEEFKILQQPLLIGTSRKSFIGHVLQRPISDRLLGTAATVCLSILKGAHIIRIHDVKPLKDLITMTDAILQSQTFPQEQNR